MQGSMPYLVIAVSIGLAPVPEAPPAFDVVFLRSLIGESHLSDKLDRVRQKFGNDPVASYFTDSGKPCFYHSWKIRGFGVRYDGDSQVTAVFLYAAGVEGFEEYKGELPERLSFKDSIDEVRKKLGQEERFLPGGANVRPVLEYGHKGLDVNLTLGHPSHVANIIIYKPERVSL
jgi:hypothetical protein